MPEDQAIGGHAGSTFRVGVVGAGFMGTGIAQAAATAAIEVIVFEPERQPLERSQKLLAEALDQLVSRGKLARDDADTLTSGIQYTTLLEDLEGVNGVIEAVSEDPELKRKLFKELDERAPHALFLASNTSSVPIAELAAQVERPERVLGLHFFSPVPVMKLVEIVVAIDTAADTVAAAHTFASALGKTPIETKDRAGFVVNMLLVPYLMAGIRMLEEGFANRDDIDTGMRLGCGHPMGPLQLCDFVGLDVLHAICESLYDEFRLPEYAPPPLLKRMVASGRHGRKNGRGFYEYIQETQTTGAAK